MAPRKKASKEPDDLDIALEQHLTYTTELVSGAGGNRGWTCQHCARPYTSSRTRQCLHLLGPKGKDIAVCTAIPPPDREELQAVFNRIYNTPGAIDAGALQ